MKFKSLSVMVMIGALALSFSSEAQPGTAGGGRPVTLPGQLSPANTLPAPFPPVQTLPGRLPPGRFPPVQTLPAPLAPVLQGRVNASIGLILIEDKAANAQYLSTLQTSGDGVPGSPSQAIFGARLPGLGAKKPAVWYTHRADSQIKQLRLLAPAQAFRGWADEHGQAAGWSGGDFSPDNGRQVNPVLSEEVFNQFVQAAPGASKELSFTEVSADGHQREFHTQVSKQAQLILTPPTGQACRDEVVQGQAGKLCVLRNISGQSVAVTGGDLRFTVRAKFATVTSRFRVGQEWHRLGDSIGLAEFAHSQAIEVFFVPPSAEQIQAWQAAHPNKRLADLVEAGFYSGSRLARGDRFNLSLNGAQIQTGHRTVLSRLSLLTIDDQTTQHQYVTTLNGHPDQALYGARQAQSPQRAVTWYLERGAQPPLYPLQRTAQAQPAQIMAGVADNQGRMSIGRAMPLAGQVNPVFNEQAFATLMQQPVGQQQELSVKGVRSNGDEIEYRTNVIKSAVLKLSSPVGQVCRKETLDGVAGQICVLRHVAGENQAVSGGDIRFMIRARRSLPAARFRVGQQWHPLGDSVAIAEFAGSRQIELFLPRPAQPPRQPVQISSLVRPQVLPTLPLAGLVDAFIYSSGRQQQGDLFYLSLNDQNALALSPDAGEVRFECLLGVSATTKAVISSGVVLTQYGNKPYLYMLTVRGDQLGFGSVIPRGDGIRYIVVDPAYWTEGAPYSVSIYVTFGSSSGGGAAQCRGDGSEIGPPVPPVPPFKVSSVSSETVRTGSDIVIKVDFSDASTVNQLIDLTPNLVSARAQDVDWSRAQISLNKTSWSDWEFKPGSRTSVSLPKGKSAMYIKLPTIADSQQKANRVFTMTAAHSDSGTSAKGTETIQPPPPPPSSFRVNAVSSETVKSGATMSVKVSFTPTATGSEVVQLKPALLTARAQDVDWAKAQLSFDGSTWSSLALSVGNNTKVTVPAGGSEIYVQLPTVADSKQLTDRTFTLLASHAGSGSSATGTETIQPPDITPPPSFRVSTVSSETVKAGGSMLVKVMFSQMPTKDEVIKLAPLSGTVRAQDVDWAKVTISFNASDWISLPMKLDTASTATVPAGSTSMMWVMLPTVLDPQQQADRTFTMAVTHPVSSSTAQGTETIQSGAPPFPSTGLKIASVSSETVIAGSKMTVKVMFSSSSVKSEVVKLLPVLETARVQDVDWSGAQVSFDGSGWTAFPLKPNDTLQNLVTVPANARSIAIMLSTVADLQQQTNRTFSMGAAHAPSNTAAQGVETIQPIPSNFGVASVSSESVQTGGQMTVKVAFTEAARKTEEVSLSALLGTARQQDVDWSGVAVSFDNVSWKPLALLPDQSAVKVAVSSGNTVLYVKLPTIRDATQLTARNFQIKAATSATSAQGTETIQPLPYNFGIASVSSESVGTGNTMTVKVGFIEPARKVEDLLLGASLLTARQQDVDWSKVAVSFDNVSWTPVLLVPYQNPVKVSAPSGAAEMYVRLPTVRDPSQWTIRTFQITASAGNTSAQGTESITPPVALQVSSITDVTVPELTPASMVITLNGQAQGNEVLHLQPNLLSGTPAGIAIFAEAKITYLDGSQQGQSKQVMLVPGQTNPPPDVVLPKDVQKIQLVIRTTYGYIPAGKENTQFKVQAWINSGQAESKSNTVTVTRYLPALISVSDETVTEGQTATVTVSFDPTLGASSIRLRPVPGTAVKEDVDWAKGEQSVDGIVWQPLSLIPGQDNAVSVPAGVRALQLRLPTINNHMAEDSRAFQIIATAGAVSKQGTVTILRYTGVSLDEFSIKATGNSTVTAPLGGQSPDVVIPYQVKIALSNVAGSYLAGNLAPLQVKRLLQARSKMAMRVTARVSGPSLPTQGKAMCAFAINQSSDRHAAIPAYFGYQKQAAGGWQDTPQNCSASPDLVLRDDAQPGVGGDWKEWIDQKAGTAVYTLETRLGFKMNDSVSIREIETGREWLGAARAEGKVIADLVLDTGTP